MKDNELEIEKEIRRMLSQLSGIGVSELEDEVRIREELGIDSLRAMEIVARCEKHWGIRIDEERLLQIETVGDFVSLLSALLRQMLD